MRDKTISSYLYLVPISEAIFSIIKLGTPYFDLKVFGRRQIEDRAFPHF